MARIHRSYFLNSDVVYLAKDLIGKTVHTCFDGQHTAGIITETEAYNGRTDKASHAYPNKRTKRTEIMYSEGGIAYVYLCYGIHHLLNFVSNREGLADAILIRAIEPTIGIDTMLKRRNKKSLNASLSSGPGTLSQALGITTDQYGLSLESNSLWLEEPSRPLKASDIVVSKRIGIDYAEEDALLPWRFYLKDSDFVSKR